MGDADLGLKAYTAKILAAIQYTKSTLEHKIDQVSQELELLWVDHRMQNEKVGTTERSLVLLTPAITGNEDCIKTEAQFVAMGAKFNDLKGHFRLNNDQIVGALEQAEGLPLELYMEDRLDSSVLQGETF
ncbi:hypothetical protein NDU88_006528 [Pleurodeles waltl]|uniref:Uncharacterized protein n=1 Tax=Pleurodeles waltl TaxID=8319 RepID=A0AAV7QJ03_PLEWA|nr:hypothetical protein NDU88_006528 [Pleurodeles waltl]